MPLHPLTQTMYQATEILSRLGFRQAMGPEIETEFNNFDALNVPADHPARDMQDTFWLKPTEQRRLLRTHTTAVSLRLLAEGQLPLRAMSTGRVFRHEATDATHEAQFYQLDGVVVDKEVSLAQLKGTLAEFFRQFFGREAEVRFRPSYFPFVEPGVEVDIKWGERWLEVMGAGMLHPNVFRAVGQDPKVWRGFAFGGGVDRLTMLKFGIPDVRLFYGGDIRFLNQF